MPLPSGGASNFFAQYYYTKTELNAGQLDTLYFGEDEFINTSAGAGDAGKPIKLDASGLIAASMLAGGTVATHAALTAAHGATGAVVGTTNAQTLTNKTLTAPTIATPAVQGTASFYRTGTGATLTLYDGGDANPWIIYSGVSASAEFSIYDATAGAHRLKIASDGTVTVPSLTATTSATVNGAAVTTASNTQTLTNKTLTAPVIATISNSGTITLPTGTRTLVARDTTDTLTNKTLTSPVITGGTQSSPTITTPTFSGSGGAAQATLQPVSGQYTQLNLNNAAGTQSASFGWDNTNGFGYLSSDGMILYLKDSKLGVSNNNPAVTLDVTGTINASTAITVNSVAVTTASNTQTLTNKTFSNVTTFSATNGAIALGPGTNSVSYIDVNGTRAFFGYDSVSNNAVIQAGVTKGLEFCVNSGTFGAGTAMYIASGGEVIVGGATADHNFEVQDAGASNYRVTVNLNATGVNYINSYNNAVGGFTGAPLALFGSRVIVNAGRFNIDTTHTPASAGATGTTGDIAWDTSYIYVAVGTNTWKRAALSTW